MENQQPESARGTFVSMLLTFLFGGGFLLFLILVTGGFFLYVALAVLGVGSIGLFHYFAWGSALTNEVAAERAAEEEKARVEADQRLHHEQYGIRRM